MDCRDVLPLLDLYREGQLSPAEAEQVAEHLGRCWGCRNRHAELARCARTLVRLPHAEPRPELLAATLLALPVPGRPAAHPKQPAWKAALLGTGTAASLLIFLWLIAEAILAFESAGGAEFASLIGTHPDLLLSHPSDATLALLEALPLADVLIGLCSALVAWLLGIRLVAAIRTPWGWPRLISGVV